MWNVYTKSRRCVALVFHVVLNTKQNVSQAYLSLSYISKTVIVIGVVSIMRGPTITQTIAMLYIRNLSPLTIA